MVAIIIPPEGGRSDPFAGAGQSSRSNPSVQHTAADLVKWKDIYDLLEATMDGCETAANVLEAMAIKNA